MRTITDKQREEMCLYPGHSPRIQGNPIRVRHKNNLIIRLSCGAVIVSIGYFDDSQWMARDALSERIRKEIMRSTLFHSMQNGGEIIYDHSC